MGDYIDRQVAIDYIEENKRRLGITNCNAWNFKDILRAQPAADVAPVVHGRWEFEHMTGDRAYYAHCSKCGKRKHFRDYLNEDNFCPNCGAKMDKEVNKE